MSRILSLALGPVASKLLVFEGCNFREPVGEGAIVPPDSVTWRVFSNPVAVYIGGVAAVLLELGEPRVRAGVWENSSFRRDPGERLRRTGAAAMVTVYGARSEFEALAQRVNGIHAHIRGTTPEGRPYRADDPELLQWVQVTASYAFMEAYHAYVRPLSAGDRDRFYAEATRGAALYGLTDPPPTEAAVQQLLDEVKPHLEPSEIIDDFLHIMRTAPILPLPFRPLQRLIVRAAVELLPGDMRARIGIADEPRLNSAGRAFVRQIARAAELVEVPTAPWVQACERLGLPGDYLARRR